uniref:Protein kinase domain-containing protein n=1 Tax=Aureoumbra lagunensis TaxID=44058 RepID=A0A7S3JRR4_9STRA
MDEVAKMSIKELKAIIHRANLSTVGIFEKDELRQLALEAQARFASDTSDGMPCDNTTHFSSDFNQRSIPIVQQHGTVSQVKTNDCNSERKRLKPGHEINGAKKGRVVIKRWLGSGAFADVYQVETNKVVLKHEAMKVIILKSQNDKLISDAERIRRLRPHVIEAHLMLKLGRHANLVGVNAAFQINEDFYFFQDLVSGGQTLKSTMSLLTIDQAILVAYKIANGLAYMHDTCYFCFWDLNPSQVLVELLGADMNRAVGAVKLSGFGCSGRIGCTWAYASPQTRALLVQPAKKLMRPKTIPSA